MKEVEEGRRRKKEYIITINVVYIIFISTNIHLKLIIFIDKKSKYFYR